ncbi:MULTISPECIES: helix-turn-helix domain-containing protein [Clostridium]|uniref:Helix-turn-helix domain-containing protein n=1 Tax=Clostridium lapidicellarium TaxID=3240931 RepID=A0ABV4DWE9_9CLOT
MLPQDFEEKAKEITGLTGKYTGRNMVKLEDGSTITLGDNVALQIIDNDDEYGSIMYDKYRTGSWESSSMSVYKRKDPDKILGGLLDDVYTLAEAAQKWGLSDGSVLRNAIRQGRFREDEYRQSGATWLITKPAMQRVYGKSVS